MNEEQARIVEGELQQLLDKKAIDPIPVEQALRPDHCVSEVFAISKQDGGYRMITNMKPYNKGLCAPKFKMEGIADALALLQPGFFLAKIDIKDAYLQVAIAEQHRNHLCIHWRDRYYRFNVLPFGISIAPHMFTKIMRAAFRPLALSGVTKIAYIDDILLIANTREELQRVVTAAVTHLRLLGFLLNDLKCVLTPQQHSDFLGFHFDTELMTISLPLKKRLKLQLRCQLWKNMPSLSTRALAQIIRSLESTRPALKEALTFTRELCFVRLEWLQLSDDYDTIHQVPDSVREVLAWWTDRLSRPVSRPIKPPVPQFTLTTDASNTGWGATLHDRDSVLIWTGNGLWTEHHHNNILEILAVLHALQQCHPLITGQDILIRSDNTATVAYIRRGGGRRLSLFKITLQIVQLCQAHDINYDIEHLAGVKNTEADALSRLQDKTDWRLKPHIWETINSRWTHDIDGFASASNHLLPRYYEWTPGILGPRMNALAHSWTNQALLLNPPFKLIPRCLDKIIRDRTTATLIYPKWRACWQPLLDLLTIDEICLGPGPLIFDCANPEAQHTIQQNPSWTFYAARLDGSTRLTTNNASLSLGKTGANT